MPPFSGNRAVLLELALKQTRKMFNSPCGGLKRPYLDPGAQYARNLWDWDSYWASVALLGIAAEVKDDAFSAEVLKHAKGSLLTFFDYQAPDGSMPILLDGEGVDVFETRNPGQNIVLGLSSIAGILVVAIPMLLIVRKVLNRFHRQSFYTLFGILLATIVGCVIQEVMRNQAGIGFLRIVVLVVLFAGGVAASYAMDSATKKLELNEETAERSTAAE